uniref:Uncharacterized protein n=1 Tax=Arundo donax TaxID=35708 RepID=A0A0A8Z9G7_ARUDO
MQGGDVYGNRGCGERQRRDVRIPEAIARLSSGLINGLRHSFYFTLVSVSIAYAMIKPGRRE